jgi:hypothetical protein
MPNVICNRTVFHGPQAALDWIRNTNMNFQKMLPCPYIPSDGSRPQTDEWYNWCIAEWGTKWSAWDPEFATEEGALHARYRTAWDPAHGLLSYLSQRFPGLRIENRYVEEFQQRYGYTVYESGVFTDQHILPDQFSGSSLQAFSTTVDWFDYEVYADFVSQMGGVLDGDRDGSPVRLVENHLTRDEFVAHFA